MLIDDYGMRIFLSSIPNGHVLALGISGTGKSYYLNRRIEELRYSGETCLVLDWAGSFSETERKKSRITVQGGIQDLNLSKSKICLPVMNGKSEDIDMFVSWITNVFRIQGSVQRIMIREAAESMLREQEPSLFRFLEKCYELKESAESLGCIDDVRRMEKIIERVEPFILSDVITFWDGTGIGLDSSQLVIVELDSLTPSLKKMCVDTIFWWVWQKAKSGTFFFRNVVLDEAQHINFNEVYHLVYYEKAENFL